MTKPPWEFHEDLSRDRLQLVAKILATLVIPLLLSLTPLSAMARGHSGVVLYEHSANMVTEAAREMLPSAEDHRATVAVHIQNR